MNKAEVKRLREREKENLRLKKIVTNQATCTLPVKDITLRIGTLFDQEITKFLI
jgi:hypothetical protein